MSRDDVSSKERFLADVFARERLDLASLRRNTYAHLRPGLQDAVLPFALNVIRPRTANTRIVNLRDVVGSSVAMTPMTPIVVDRKHMVFGLPKPDEPVVARTSVEHIPLPPISSSDKKKRKGEKAGPVKAEPVKRRRATVAATPSSVFVPLESLYDRAEPVVTRRALLSPVKDPHPALERIFNEFWLMDFGDPSVTAAFFARIDSRNCADYGLTEFAHKACSLPVIKEKLEARSYSSGESFQHDFNTLFENILTYYPPAHPATVKALDLRALFNTRWEACSGSL